MFLPFSPYHYLIIFAGLILAGETVLLPAFYVALVGYLDVWTLLALAVAATLVSDVLWYFFGAMLPWERLMRFSFLKRRSGLIERLNGTFQVRGLSIVFLSKFIYGTRIIVQVVAGAHRLPFWRYLAVNTAGIVVWNGILLSFVVLAHTGARTLGGTTRQLQFGFLIAVAIVLALHWIAKRVLLPRLLPPRQNGA